MEDKKRPTLYINACVRRESRTAKLAEKLLARLSEPYEELCLQKIIFPVVDEEYLRKRDGFIAKQDFEDPMFDLARQFQEAQTIVIAAPYWDYSFPATLKQYFEQINVVGVTFKYTESGIPVGLCNAKRLFYVTTAGGNYVPDVYGFGYVKVLAQSFYGIPEVKKIEAVGLDIVGADVSAIMQEAEKKIEEI